MKKVLMPKFILWTSLYVGPVVPSGARLTKFSSSMSRNCPSMDHWCWFAKLMYLQIQWDHSPQSRNSLISKVQCPSDFGFGLTLLKMGAVVKISNFPFYVHRGRNLDKHTQSKFLQIWHGWWEWKIWNYRITKWWDGMGCDILWVPIHWIHVRMSTLRCSQSFSQSSLNLIIYFAYFCMTKKLAQRCITSCAV